MGTGSPIEARMNSQIWTPLLIGIVIIGILVIIFFLIKFIKAKLNLPSKVERQKAKKTTRRNIARVADSYSLTRAEESLLSQICKKHRVPNIEYFFDDAKKTNELFLKVFKELTAQSKTDAEQTVFFSLLSKINNHRFLFRRHNSFRSIPPGQKMSYVDEAGKNYKTVLIENNDREMVLRVPKDEYDREVRPPELSKINLFFLGNNDIAYTVTVRVVRYQERLSVPEMVVTHSLAGKEHMREEYLFIPAQIPCEFSSVKTAPGKKNTVVYEASGEMRKGMLVNFSGETCNIATKEPAAIQQNINIKVSLDGEAAGNIIAVVTNTAHNDATALYVLHAKYVEMDDKIRNYILARVHEFIKPAGEE